MDPLTAAKFFTLCMIAGFMSMVGGFALGDVSDQLLTWFDSYSESGKTKQEGTDVDTGKADPNGTAAEFDLIYHYVVLGAGYAVMTTIAAGGYWFLDKFLVYYNPTDCDLNAISATDLDKMK